MNRPKFTDDKYQHSKNDDVMDDIVEYLKDLEKYCDFLEGNRKFCIGTVKVECKDFEEVQNAIHELVENNNKQEKIIDYLIDFIVFNCDDVEGLTCSCCKCKSICKKYMSSCEREEFKKFILETVNNE